MLRDFVFTDHRVEPELEQGSGRNRQAVEVDIGDGTDGEVRVEQFTQRRSAGKPFVRLADAACDKLGVGIHGDDSIVLATLPEPATLGLNELRLAELEIAIEDASRQSDFTAD